MAKRRLKNIHHYERAGLRCLLTAFRYLFHVLLIIGTIFFMVCFFTNVTFGGFIIK